MKRRSLVERSTRCRCHVSRIASSLLLQEHAWRSRISFSSNLPRQDDIQQAAWQLLIASAISSISSSSLNAGSIYVFLLRAASFTTRQMTLFAAKIDLQS